MFQIEIKRCQIRITDKSDTILADDDSLAVACASLDETV